VIDAGNLTSRQYSGLTDVVHRIIRRGECLDADRECEKSPIEALTALIESGVSIRGALGGFTSSGDPHST
jgi:hypothetical protein